MTGELDLIRSDHSGRRELIKSDQFWPAAGSAGGGITAEIRDI